MGPQPPLPAQPPLQGVSSILRAFDPVGETFWASPASGRGESGQDTASDGERENSLLERELDLSSQ